MHRLPGPASTPWFDPQAPKVKYPWWSLPGMILAMIFAVILAAFTVSSAPSSYSAADTPMPGRVVAAAPIHVAHDPWFGIQLQCFNDNGVMLVLYHFQVSGRGGFEERADIVDRTAGWSAPRLKLQIRTRDNATWYDLRTSPHGEGEFQYTEQKVKGGGWFSHGGWALRLVSLQDRYASAPYVIGYQNTCTGNGV